ncbi:MAG: hypothetical protein F6J92_29340 [Symploca sp. SIO1A3]|nr:hypothetical protein [Symploca sp. SIO1A3]
MARLYTVLAQGVTTGERKKGWGAGGAGGVVGCLYKKQLTTNKQPSSGRLSLPSLKKWASRRFR